MNDRRLAAIMFTDIVGYTSLMADDEVSALKVLEAQRDLLEPSIAFHNGQWLKEMGDGTLSSFASAADAVQAAIDIQKQCRESSNFKLRIGIHLGDVVFNGADVFGDGVNIAARIEPIAEPGGIAVSGSVFDTIGNNKNFQASFLGEKELKGISRPVRVYGIRNDDLPVPAPDQLFQKESQRSADRHKGTVPIALLFMAVVAPLLVFVFSSSENENQDGSSGITSLPVSTSANSHLTPETLNTALPETAIAKTLASDLNSAKEQAASGNEIGRDLPEDKYVPPVIDSEPALVSPAAADLKIAENPIPVEPEVSEDIKNSSAHPVPVLESSQVQFADSERSVLK
ncbi:MAG: adenylate/guanylate cyclase domain-containing protein [Pseudohongiellaceae bacterium]